MNTNKGTKYPHDLDKVFINLLYKGPAIENGTMSLQDVTPILQGFSGAYETLVNKKYPKTSHQIYISDIRTGSVEIVLEAWQWITENTDALTTATAPILVQPDMVFSIMSTIFEISKLKIHIGNEAYTEQVGDRQSIVINNADNVKVNFNHITYQLYKDGDLDINMRNLVQPLEAGRIDSAEFKVTSTDGKIISQTIRAEDRPSFEPKQITITKTQKVEQTVTLNSLTKTTNNGFLYLANAKRVPYSYKGENDQKLYEIFGNENKPIKIICEAHMNDQLEVISVDIYDLDRIQGSLFN